jgi:hypothetical protein
MGNIIAKHLPPHSTGIDNDPPISLGSNDSLGSDTIPRDPMDPMEIRETFKGLYAPRIGEHIDKITGNVLATSARSFAKSQRAFRQTSLQDCIALASQSTSQLIDWMEVDTTSNHLMQEQQAPPIPSQRGKSATNKPSSGKSQAKWHTFQPPYNH